MFEKKKENNTNNVLIAVIIFMAIVIGVMAFFLGKNFDSVFKKETGNTEITKTDTTKTDTGKVVDNSDLTVTILWDKRIGEDVTGEDFAKQFQNGLPSMKTANIVVKDFSDDGVKEFMQKNKIELLPAAVFSKNDFDVSVDTPMKGQDGKELKVIDFLKALPNGEFSLNIGGNYDPLAEVCDNKIDDNGDGKIDCDDSKCSKELSCAAKVDKPKAELFVMSYCPYGTQAQKGFLEAMLKLEKVADMKVKFVNYTMHGAKEGEENINQYCIEKEQQDKYKDYLKCFLTSGKTDECKKETKIDETKIAACIKTTKADINYDSKSTAFKLHDAENKKYGVQGSPTFVLNGIKVEKIGRSAKAYADAICSTFKEKPEVCNEEFSNTTYDPMFGFTSNGTTVAGACGG